ncbi:hypothetical protein ACIBBB_03565 [Streptomyces sp. NPDC051217]|uniref:hypothetical protein n=1 Tax=Streptomyces sp. NPDC051217 TaxID=3365644 RepID=UPI00379643A6
MRRFVVVEASAVPAVLHARCADASFSVRLGGAADLRCEPVIDEHLVVDADTCRDGSLLDCADVLQGSRAHTVADALRRLTDLTSAHPARGIAAVPLTGVAGAGGWAVAGGTDRAVILVPYETHQAYAVSGERSLLPSCLHTWLVAGRSLREWPQARVAPLG